MIRCPGKVSALIQILRRPIPLVNIQSLPYDVLEWIVVWYSRILLVVVLRHMVVVIRTETISSGML